MTRKVIRMTAFVAVAAILAGCQAVAKMERENFQRECDNLGLVRGTPVYDKCMLQQQALEEERTQRMLDRMAEEERRKNQRR